jgi:hypothetical protein
MTPPRKILTISLARHLHGTDASQVVEKDWSINATAEQRSRFDNVGFNLDPTNEEDTLAELKTTLQGDKWDGVIVGWCSRGNKTFTVLFEQVVSEVVREIVRRANGRAGEEDDELKLLFCSGPDDLVGASLRAFP